MIHVLAWVCHRDGLRHADEFSLLGRVVFWAQIHEAWGAS